ncbi:MFS transporter [Aeromicrobium wangtongii]|uniref:MFS transporter n=1 Tax=Aeromicrobium wangtongii TaxID=2969247 RepID=A0ABY5MB96_9ACTN|nr:MFS transporter [Aeromicrobium wangtongii]MCD9197917.1 MFS transporter [Aeromicrobium wangtongii]UUP15395.1 MFS transporter [Aeromicrobium wangtongii]
MTAQQVPSGAEASAEASVGTKYVVMTVSATLGVLSGLLSVILIPLLPALQTEFKLTASEVSWLFTLPILVAGGSSLVVPRLADLIGDRRANVVTMSFLTVGCLIAGLFKSFPMLLVAMFFIGIGSTVYFLGFALLRRHLPGDNAIRTAAAIVTIATGTGMTAGLVLGGLLTEKVDVSVSTMYLILGVCAALATVAAHVVIPPDEGTSEGSLGIASVALGVTWIGALLFGMAQGQSWGWTDWRVLSLVIGGLVLAVIWVRIERQSATPIFDVETLQNPDMRRAMLGLLGFGLANVPLMLVTPYVAQLPKDMGGLGLTALGTGLLLVPWSIAYLIGGAAVGLIKVGPYALAVTGFIVMALSFTSMALFHGSIWQLVTGVAVYGFASAVASASCYAIGQGAVPERLAGMATTMLGTTQVVASSIAGPIIGVILAARDVPGIPGVPASSQFTIAYLIAAALSVAAAVACMKRSPVRQSAGRTV